MKYYNLTLFVIFIGVISSCTKENDLLLNSLENQSSEKSQDLRLHWEGAYATESYDYYVYDKERYFISNGIAQLNHSPWSNYFTHIKLYIPYFIKIDGDSTKFEVFLQNPNGISGSVFANDVCLQMQGTKNIAGVCFNSASPYYTYLTVGNEGIVDSKSLVYHYQTWTILSLEAKNNTLSVFRDGNLIESISYDGIKIGKLKYILIGFKGSGSADWAKLSNSQSGERLMFENFNKEGQSNIVWNKSVFVHHP